ncbi:MAG: hypothetical protein A2161_14370 [Candidatus Schekmanbacteria bacterium RBG_13_48_7]|uniref:Uncharacterized protein n=1 Tax=Candidatus Schekmanbacteria bacterium RBG_13_48_7 TaxID=1817878 RepID=A0A1F7RR78_9BACT|nr:MAG: hypothetical protein A2161_14370 [Candidatus Schekmanbacteria bacterium RBG_13_48_7]
MYRVVDVIKVCSAIIALGMFICIVGCSGKTVDFEVPQEKPTDIKEEQRVRPSLDSEPVFVTPKTHIPGSIFENYVIGPEDILDVSVWQNETLRRTLPVLPDGKIYFPLIGEIRAAGRTVSQLEKDLNDALDEFILSPQVSVSVKESNSKKFFVLGQVRNPSVYSMKREVTILEAVSYAGGLTEFADSTNVYITRGDKSMKLDLYDLFSKGDLTQNLILQPGDLINIPSINTQKIMVFGEINQGVLPMTRGLTIAEAVASRGGFRYTSSKWRVKVIRGSLSRPEVFSVDFNQLFRGDLNQNIKLEAGDIIFVHSTSLAWWNRFVDQLLGGFLRPFTAYGQAVITSENIQNLTQ